MTLFFYEGKMGFIKRLLTFAKGQVPPVKVSGR